MPQTRVRAGFGVFGVLCALFGINLFGIQGSVTAAASKRIIFPGSASAQAIVEPAAAAPVTAAYDDAPAQSTAAEPAPVPSFAPAVTTGSVAEPDLIRAVQRELQAQGYEAGGIDGVAGVTTRAAVMAFEWDQGMPLTGEPAQRTLQALLMGARSGPAGSASAVAPAPQAVQVIRTVQQGLTALGFGDFKSPGQLTPETQRAIRQFEAREGLTETGRISGALAARIVRLSGEKRLAVRG